MSHLALTQIDREEPEELPTIPPEELEQLDKESTLFQVSVLEEKLAKMKPNMAAIAEYRKKVNKWRQFSCQKEKKEN